MTPDLSEPGSGDGFPRPAALAPRMLFWPMVPASTGARRRRRSTSRPPISPASAWPSRCRCSSSASSPTTATRRQCQCRTTARPAARRQASLGGAVVAYAPFDAADKGDPRLPTQEHHVSAGNAVGFKVAPKFHPEVARRRSRHQADPEAARAAGFHRGGGLSGVLRDHAFAAAQNEGQIFLKLTKAKPLTFGGALGQAKSDALGALATPADEPARAVQDPRAGRRAKTPRSAGNVEAQARRRSGTARSIRVTFFKDATILGGITLGDILRPKSEPLAARTCPRWWRAISLIASKAQFRLDAPTSPRPTRSKLLIPRADPAKPPTRLTMERRGADAVRSDGGGRATRRPPTLNNFKVNLFGFIILWFEQI